MGKFFPGNQTKILPYTIFWVPAKCFNGNDLTHNSKILCLKKETMSILGKINDQIIQRTSLAQFSIVFWGFDGTLDIFDSNLDQINSRFFLCWIIVIKQSGFFCFCFACWLIYALSAYLFLKTIKENHPSAILLKKLPASPECHHTSHALHEHRQFSLSTHKNGHQTGNYGGNIFCWNERGVPPCYIKPPSQSPVNTSVETPQVVPINYFGAHKQLCIYC